jgi:protein-histidine pros-kinase
MQLAVQRANGVFWTFMISLAVVFLLGIVAINLLLIFLVIRPVNQLSTMASSMSLGNSDITEFPVMGQDEIAELSLSFNRMGRSLAEAMKLLRA